MTSPYGFTDYEGRQLEGDLTHEEERIIDALLGGTPRSQLASKLEIDQRIVTAVLTSDWLPRVLGQREDENYTRGRRMISVAFPNAVLYIAQVLANKNEKTADRLRAAEKLTQLALDAETRHITHVKIARIQAQLSDDEDELSGMSPEEQLDQIMRKYANRIAVPKAQA